MIDAKVAGKREGTEHSLDAYINDANDDCEIPAEHDDNADLDLQMPSQQNKLLGAEA